MPAVRPFRALRYDPAVVGDLGAVICPPYDVISAAARRTLLARHPSNAVRIELPIGPGEEPGTVAGSGRADHEARYREAAATLREWRRDGTMRQDERPALYVYEQRYHLPGDPPGRAERTQRGFFARLRLEPLGDGIRPHERTLSAPKEDRLRLLRATATDTSPIVVLSDDQTGRTATTLERITAGPPGGEATDSAGIRHRIWAVSRESAAAGKLVAGAEARPLTIADGHHRYETALRYRDERRAEAAARNAAGGDGMGGLGAGDDPAFDFVLALVLDAGGRSSSRPIVLPTHRLVAGNATLARTLERTLGTYFSMTERPPADLVRDFSPPFKHGGSDRFAFLVGKRAYALASRANAIDRLLEGDVPTVVRLIDSAVLDAVLDAVLGRLLAGAADGRRAAGSGQDALLRQLSYTHDAEAALRAVESGAAAAAFLLRPTPVRSVIEVAAAGALMPQKSTYFYPKVATGLVMYALE